MTLLEIDDISNLLKALFKINIDIAHREYFLKVDIPEVSDWWYGYRLTSDIICFESETTSDVVCDENSSNIVCYEGGIGAEKWISFEPTVEFKFSNFHYANQVENGKLICTTKG